MKTFPVRSFSGIETKYSSEDQDRGTLRKAAGVVPVPAGALTSGPNWQAAWGLSTFATSAATALSGATVSKVHFLTVTRSGQILLVAWEITAARPRGIWHVGGSGDPSFSAGSGATLASPNNTTYRDKTNSLPWYGRLLDTRLFLGNGTDSNLVWQSGALAVLGPTSTPTDSDDLSKVAIPACLAFAQDHDGVIYAAGNVTYPLRVWFTEKPTARFPQPSGLASASSYADVVAPSGVTITALTTVGGRVYAHLSNRGVVPIPPNALAQIKAEPTVHAGAMNPNCVADHRQRRLYLGTDLEVYNLALPAGDDSDDARDKRLATDRSSGVWNVDMTRPASGSDYSTVYDDKNGRLWLWATMSAGSRQGLYCYDERKFAITGPWRHPDFLSVNKVGDGNLTGVLAIGITRDGALLYSDVADIGELTLPAYSDAIGADYAEFASAGAAAGLAGIPTVGVSADGLQFKQVLNGQTLSMATPWSDFAVADVTCTKFYKNAHLVVIEPSLEDFGDVAGAKDVLEILLNWRRNQRAYVGVYVECDGMTDGRWLGTSWPEAQQVFPMMCKGATLRIRIVAVCFNASQALLSGLAVGYLPGVR